jgi:hypothetical protein
VFIQIIDKEDWKESGYEMSASEGEEFDMDSEEEEEDAEVPRSIDIEGDMAFERECGAIGEHFGFMKRLGDEADVGDWEGLQAQMKEWDANRAEHMAALMCLQPKRK